MDKEDVAHIDNRIILSHKREWNWVICRDMAGPRVCHTEGGKSEREKYYIATHIYGIEKIGIDDLIYKAEIETQM